MRNFAERCSDQHLKCSDKRVPTKATKMLMALFQIIPISSKLKFEARNLLMKLKSLLNQGQITKKGNVPKIMKHARGSLWLFREGHAHNVIRQEFKDKLTRKRCS